VINVIFSPIIGDERIYSVSSFQGWDDVFCSIDVYYDPVLSPPQYNFTAITTDAEYFSHLYEIATALNKEYSLHSAL